MHFFHTFGEYVHWYTQKFTSIQCIQTTNTINVIQTSLISLYICSSSHTKKHRHTNTSSTINSSITMLCMILFHLSFFSYRHQPCFWGINHVSRPSTLLSPPIGHLSQWSFFNIMALTLYEASTSFYAINPL